MSRQERNEIEPGRLGGKPVVRGSRIRVELVVGMLADGRDERLWQVLTCKRWVLR